MQIRRFVVGPFQENAYLLHSAGSSEAILIDPGDEADVLLKAIREEALDVKYILNTHAHIDHVLAVVKVKEETGATFHLHEDEVHFLRAIPDQAKMFALPDVSEIPEVDAYITEGDEFTAGDFTLKVVHTPGHSPGGVSFLAPGAAFVGDSLFEGSIGRTDLPGGSLEVLTHSIKEKLFTLQPDTVVYPGHGELTTIGQEKEYNPFLQPQVMP